MNQDSWLILLGFLGVVWAFYFMAASFRKPNVFTVEYHDEETVVSEVMVPSWESQNYMLRIEKLSVVGDHPWEKAIELPLFIPNNKLYRDYSSSTEGFILHIANLHDKDHILFGGSLPTWSLKWWGSAVNLPKPILLLDDTPYRITMKFKDHRIHECIFKVRPDEVYFQVFEP